jgi:perosamine synthetase
MTVVTQSLPALAARQAQAFQKAIQRQFSFLKQTDRLDHLYTKAIPLYPEEGFLLPVCELHADDDALISTLSQWRRENAFAFPTQFPVTDAGTKSWLRTRLLDTPDRMLFLLVDKHGREIGHLGFASCLNDRGEMELDNIVRGVKTGYPGIMRNAMRALMKWAHEVIGPQSFFLRVFADNEHAVHFYRDLGYVDDQKQPLRKQVRGENISYVAVEPGDAAAPDKVFLRMVYAPQRNDAGKEMILTAGPSVSALEVFYTFDAARSGWNQQWNGYLNRFESAFAQYIGVPHAIATSSCTGALHIALAALGIGPGDEVIVPDITWVATANAVLYVGATPIFADIEPDTWCLDPVSFESKITERTKVVMPVHLYGHPARMDKIVAIARKHKLFIVEDAAPAIGAEYQGQKTGTFGDFAAFSFQGAKLVVTGEGGMLLTNNSDLHKKAQSIWDQGRSPVRTFWIDERGVKYKMSNMQAAFGLGQLERVDELVEMKRRIFEWYAEGLRGVPHIQLNHEVAGARSIYWMSSFLLDEKAGLTRDGLRDALKKRNVDSRPVFPAISQYPIWPLAQPPLPTAKRVGLQALNLPSGVCLRREQVDYVCRCIKEILHTSPA